MSSTNNISLTTTVTQDSVAYFSAINGFNLMATIKAPQYKATERSPVDMICVVDRSGSMGGEKMRLVKDTLNFVISQLTASDRLAIVAYDNVMEVPLELQSMSEHGKQTAIYAVSTIEARGGTNLCGGLVKGIELMRNRGTKNEVASVLLFTDGQANEGYTSLADITRAMVDPDFANASYSPYSSRGFPPAPMNAYAPMNAFPVQQQQMPNFAPFQQQQQQMPNIAPFQNNFDPIPIQPVKKTEGKQVPLPCTVYTFGFGSDHDPNLLKGIAEKGSGIYYFIEKTSNISEAFADCLGGLLSVVGQNITLRFESLFDVKIEKVWTKFKTEVVSPNSIYELSIGDIQSEEQRDILLSVTVPAIPEAIDQFELVRVTLKYQNVIESKQATAVASAIISRPAKSVDSKPNFELNKQYNRLLSAEAMEKATEAGNSGNLELGRKLLQNAINSIRESVSASDPFCQSLLTDLTKCEEKLKDRHVYMTEGQMMLNNNYAAHYMQRSSNVNAPSQAAYQTSSRMQQQMFFKKM